jgi:cell wall-associated NlpC family hydrolase
MRPIKDNKDIARQRLVSIARQQLGKPYVYGAWTEEAPLRFDCSSFVQFCYRVVGIDLPRVSLQQARAGRAVRKGQELLPGDLIFVRGKEGRYDSRFPEGIGHVIMVTGPDEVIHAKSRPVGGKERGAVVQEPLSKILRRRDVTVIKRLL